MPRRRTAQLPELQTRSFLEYFLLQRNQSRLVRLRVPARRVRHGVRSQMPLLRPHLRAVFRSSDCLPAVPECFRSQLLPLRRCLSQKLPEWVLRRTIQQHLCILPPGLRPLFRPLHFPVLCLPPGHHCLARRLLLPALLDDYLRLGLPLRPVRSQRFFHLRSLQHELRHLRHHFDVLLKLHLHQQYQHRLPLCQQMHHSLPFRHLAQ